MTNIVQSSFDFNPKLCECGCGLPTPMAQRTSPKRGYRRGQPHRFIVGHCSRVRPTLTEEERFWAKVVKSDTCWLWSASCMRGGYGQLRPAKRQGNLKAHRFSYELHYGPIPEGLFVCHKCDTPACVRPDHLFLGTAKDNAMDTSAKGRIRSGERSPGAKLTTEQVKELRRLYKTGTSNRMLAKMFGISGGCASMIAHGLRWKHVK